MKTIHLVADTNLFFECKALEQLPWSDLGYDEVVLVLTKPVLDEIDKHKKAAGRTRSRALEIYGRLRGMLTNSLKEVEIKASMPRVVLRSLSSAKPDPSLKDDLDYAKNDERIVGIASTLNSAADGYEVKLFTDDTGPAMTAADFSVPFLMIPPGWRRPSAETPEDKRIKELEKENALYRLQEPKIEIGRCELADESGHIQVMRGVAVPLTSEDVEILIERLKAKHPVKIDFTPPETKVTKDHLGGVTTIDYAAPPDDKIEEYRSSTYPNWLERCRQALRSVHEGRDVMEQAVVIDWPMSNKGTRPASKVRIEFVAKGALRLRRIEEPKRIEDGDEELVVEDERPSPPLRTLPPPPTPPAFEKTVTRATASKSSPLAAEIKLASLMAAGRQSDTRDAIARAAAGGFGPTDRLSRQLRQLTSLDAAILGRPSYLDPLLSSGQPHDFSFVRPLISDFRAQLPSPKDPESFYYDWPADDDVVKGALTCELWRHHSDVETFDFEVSFVGDGPARGTIECTVHADNLTKPVEARLVISRTIESLNMFDVAEAMVENCI
ncbi:PIN domain-containing protein [Rhizobium leguminosarum]|uniref:PIN domain-containing protein n=1 Tax=Rhizobium leguminosarum TaxID=384 RepID=UPI00103CD3AE|nr:PIN domain-containing protein [Rhizobium leguminosarum]TBY27437.1 hypothetical protein E0H55_27495 [Rhizobium leguminosarum bv. viciae]